MKYEDFDDRGPKPESSGKRENLYSPYCDQFYYESSRDPGHWMAAQIVKPTKPSYILVGTHGWHGNLPAFKPMEAPALNNDYVKVTVDMRGRQFSDGQADCNGWELLDVIDAVNYVREHYSEYVIDPDVVYFQSGSGGGGNGYAIIGKFPDFFAAAAVFCGISDYKLWYDNDAVGEFRDEMDVWIGCAPEDNEMAYRSRSGLHLLENLHTPLFVAHGELDSRVPSEHARRYVQRAEQLEKGELVRYVELPGVGATKGHWGQATEQQLADIFQQAEALRTQHRQPVQLAERGRLVIGGYVYTKSFSIVLDSVDKVATVDYDLVAGTFQVVSDTACRYTLRQFGNGENSAPIEGEALVSSSASAD